ncbi:MAG TPA: DUF2306 domain-containing protein, partial [Herpetosiphonaceae bacterium]
DGYQPPALPANPRLAQLAALDDLFARYPALTLIHIIPGLLFMGLWPLQFNRRLRAGGRSWHRRAGWVAVASGLIVGVTAIVMSVAMPAIGGPVQAAATLVFGAGFLAALGKAVWHIRRREIARHREWMIRAFSYGLAVATIRPIIGFFFATSPLSGLAPADFFGPAFWLGFALHAAAAEWWIRRTRRRAASAGSAGAT